MGSAARLFGKLLDELSGARLLVELPGELFSACLFAKFLMGS